MSLNPFVDISYKIMYYIIEYKINKQLKKLSLLHSSDS